MLRERKKESERERKRERERTRISDIRKNNILIIAWYEQNCDILLYNSAEEMREKYEEKSLRSIILLREKGREKEKERERKRARESKDEYYCILQKSASLNAIKCNCAGIVHTPGVSLKIKDKVSLTFRLRK